jgi:hypothetical protein
MIQVIRWNAITNSQGIIWQINVDFDIVDATGPPKNSALVLFEEMYYPPDLPSQLLLYETNASVDTFTVHAKGHCHLRSTAQEHERSISFSGVMLIELE